jgi:hypothetical protein
MGNLWFTDLPPGLPQGTPIEISISLDENMVFTIGCKVRAVDWSRTMELQHDGWQNPVLDKAMDANFKVQRGEVADPRAKEQAQNLIDKINEDVRKGDEVAAKDHLTELEKVIEEPAPLVDWKLPLKNILSLADSFWDRLKPVFPGDHEIVKSAEAWIRDARSILDGDDQNKGQEFMKTGIERLFKIPLLGELILAFFAERDPNLSPAASTRLKQAIEDVLEAFDRKDAHAIPDTVKTFRKYLSEAMESVGDGPGIDPTKVMVTI